MHMSWALYISAIYLVLCYVGTRVMANRKPFGLKKYVNVSGIMRMQWGSPDGLVRALAGWNLLLAVFSFMGALRTVPHLIYLAVTRGVYGSICWPAEPSYGCGAVGFWTMLFIFSKVPELVDTVFIVLRKKPLIFLHWYHHVTVLLYCWHSYASLTSR